MGLTMTTVNSVVICKLPCLVALLLSLSSWKVAKATQSRMLLEGYILIEKVVSHSLQGLILVLKVSLKTKQNTITPVRLMHLLFC